MKEFYDSWSQHEIDEYLKFSSVLVLFDTNVAREAKINIYGKLTSTQRQILLEGITSLFGGAPLSSNVCNKINEYCEKWYNKHIAKKKARVINVGRKK